MREGLLPEAESEEKTLESGFEPETRLAINSLAELTVIPSESIEMILDAHFNRYSQGFMDKLIKSYSEDPEDSPRSQAKGMICAIEYLYKAINYQRGNFIKFLHQEIGPYPIEENFNKLYQGLNALSKHCSNDIDDEDPVFQQCARISVLDKKVLKLQISNYFKDQANVYLQENHKHLYLQIKKDFQRENQNESFNADEICK